jgi:ribosomal protein S24E
MEIKNIHEIKNNVFDRKELTAIIISEIAPSNVDVISHLAKKLNLPEEAIKIKGIYGEFGSKEFKVKANIYPSKEHRNKVERKTKKEKESEKKEIEDAREARKAAKENKE